MHARLRMPAVIFALAVAGCSLAIQADRQQCETATDCAGAGLGPGSTCVANVCVAAAAITTPDSGEDAGPVDPVWGCLGKVKYADPDPGTTIRYRMRFLTALSNEPLVGVQYQVCNGIDTACVAPVPGTVGVTNEHGDMDVPLYRGFRGYIQLRGTGAAAIKPATLYFTPPDADVDLLDFKAQVHLLSEAEFNYLVGVVGQSVGKPVDPEAGHVFGYAFDCRKQAAAGVNVRMNPLGVNTYGYYSDPNRVPSATLSETTDYAEAGFINALPGTVSVTYNRSGQPIGSISVTVRKGEVTYTPMEPSP